MTETGLAMPRFVMGLIAVLFWVAGVWLAMDSSTFALHPADSFLGRARGCYTAIEDAFQLQKPSAWIRSTEQCAAATLVLGIPLVALSRVAKALCRRRRNAG